jgi:hypothetical protein
LLLLLPLSSPPPPPLLLLLLLPWQLPAAASWLPSWLPCLQLQELLEVCAVPPPPSVLLQPSLQG